MLIFIVLSKYDTQLDDMTFSCALLQGQLQKQEIGYGQEREMVTGVGTVNNHWNRLLAVDSQTAIKCFFPVGQMLNCPINLLLVACSCSSRHLQVGKINCTPPESPWIEVYTVSKFLTSMKMGRA